MLILLALAVALIIFVVGNAARVIRYLRLPLPLRWELYPIPKGSRERQSYGGSYFEDSEWWTKPESRGRLGELKFIAKEVLFLSTVRENFRALWIWSLLLHWGLYLYVASVLMNAAASLNFSYEAVGYIVVISGLGCLLGLIGSVGLLVTRLSHRRLRSYTGRLTIFDLLLLGGIFGTGLLSGGQLAYGFFFLPTFLKTLLAFGVSLRFPWPITTHLCLLAFFLAYFPFTHMTHAYMKFFSWHGVRWDDAPALHDSRVSRSLARALSRRVTWAAPHIASEPASWSDVVADVAGKGSAKRA